MRALHTTLALETGTAWTPALTVKAHHLAAGRRHLATACAVVRNMALFLVAPFIGLLYAVLLPFVGLAVLAWFAGKATFRPAG